MTRNTALVVGASGLGHVGNYAFYLIVGHSLGPAGLATVVALTTLGMMVLLPVSGFQAHVATSLAKADASPAGGAEVARLLRVFGRQTGVLLVALAIVGTLVGPWATAAWQLTGTTWLLTTIWLISTVALQIGVGALQGLAKFGALSATLAGPYGMLRAVFVATGIWAIGMMNTVAMAALVTSTLVGLILVGQVLAPHVRQLSVSAAAGALDSSDVSTARAASQAAWPTIAMLLAIGIVANIDTTIAPIGLAESAAGLYAGAALWGKLAFHVPAALILVVLPTIARNHAQSITSHQLAARTAAVTVGLGLACAAVLWAVPASWFGWAMGAQFIAAHPLMPLVALAMTGVALMYLHASVAIATAATSRWWLWLIWAVATAIAAIGWGNTPGGLLLATGGFSWAAVLALECSRAGIVRQLVTQSPIRPRDGAFPA